MLTISERKRLHDGFGKVGNVRPRSVGLPVSPPCRDSLLVRLHQCWQTLRERMFQRKVA
jgi:hypothetical protein